MHCPHSTLAHLSPSPPIPSIPSQANAALQQPAALPHATVHTTAPTYTEYKRAYATHAVLGAAPTLRRAPHSRPPPVMLPPLYLLTSSLCYTLLGWSGPSLTELCYTAAGTAAGIGAGYCCRYCGGSLLPELLWVLPRV